MTSYKYKTLTEAFKHQKTQVLKYFTLEPPFSKNQLKKRYQESLQTYHPDKNNNDTQANLITEEILELNKELLQLYNILEVEDDNLKVDLFNFEVQKKVTLLVL